MIQTIPVQVGNPNYRIEVDLNDQPYLFDFKWNARDQAFYFDLRESDETLIAGSLKVVTGVYIGRRVQHPLFKDGVLAAFDTSGQKLDATLDDFGTRVQLRYIPVEDLIPLLDQVAVTKKAQG